MTPDDFKALLEQMEERLSGQLEDLNDANQELIRQLNEREEGPPQMETLALPASNDVETVRMHEGYINRDFEESNSFVSPIGVDLSCRCTTVRTNARREPKVRILKNVLYHGIRTKVGKSKGVGWICPTHP